MILLIFLILILESLIRGHELQTTKRTSKALVNAIKKYKPDAKILYDLGCAHGMLSLRLKKSLAHFEIYGIDNSLIRILFAKLKNKLLRRKINFQKQDIFKTDLKNADIVYTYLCYDLMPILEKKLQKELKQGEAIILCKKCTE
jgi:2-polyprenyl-3-methyl-5-hydroxy-6-metoxy-1,4-benzoquinol methylase